MDINVTSGRKRQKFLKAKTYDGRKMGFLKTLGHLKNPWSSPFGPVHRALRGLPYSNIVPVNRYVHLIISMPIYALSYGCYSYVYVLADYSIREGKFPLCFLTLFYD